MTLKKQFALETLAERAEANITLYFRLTTLGVPVLHVSVQVKTPHKEIGMWSLGFDEIKGKNVSFTKRTQKKFGMQMK